MQYSITIYSVMVVFRCPNVGKRESKFHTQRHPTVMAPPCFSSPKTLLAGPQQNKNMDFRTHLDSHSPEMEVYQPCTQRVMGPTTFTGRHQLVMLLLEFLVLGMSHTHGAPVTAKKIRQDLFSQLVRKSCQYTPTGKLCLPVGVC